MTVLDESVKNMIDRLVGAHRTGQTLLLLFDYDGTLAPIVENPKNARLASTTRQALEQLAKSTRVRLGIVSGRAIDDLKSMVDIKGIDYAGTCGLELELDQIAQIPADAIQAGALIRQLTNILRSGISDYTGAWVEQKPLGLTVHYRNVTPSRVPDLQRQVAGSLEPFTAALHRFEGPMAIEITCNLGATKGTAVRSIVSRFGLHPVFVLYAGDAANDTDALETVASLGGIAIGVGGEFPGTAEYQLPDPLALTDLLKALANELPE